MKNPRSLFWVIVAASVSGCGPNEPSREAAAELSSRSLSTVEVEQRRERIRAYFEDRRARLPIVATTRTDSGQVIDWTPRSRDLEEPPPSAPAAEASESSGAVPTELAGQAAEDSAAATELMLQPWARGPEGTVPVVRFDVETLIANESELPENPADILRKLAPPSPTGKKRYYASWKRTGGVYHGTAGYINVWDAPGPIPVLETSIAQLAVTSPGFQQAVEAGKIESKALNGGSAGAFFFTYFRTQHEAEGDWIGGYNQIHDGWQQVSATVSPGIALSTSAFLGTQYALDLEVRLFNGNWWVRFGHEWIGYYPRCKRGDKSPTCVNKGYLFAASPAGLRGHGTRLDWFGEVFDESAPLPTFTDMGSGSFDVMGWAKAAFFRNLRYHVAPATFSYWDDSTWPTATDPGCYSVGVAGFSGDPGWRNWFFYGGPGKEAFLTCF